METATRGTASRSELERATASRVRPLTHDECDALGLDGSGRFALYVTDGVTVWDDLTDGPALWRLPTD